MVGSSFAMSKRFKLKKQPPYGSPDFSSFSPVHCFVLFCGGYKAKPKETTQITDPQLPTISSLQNLNPRKQNICSPSLMLAAFLLLPPPIYKIGGGGRVEKRTKMI